MAKIDVVITGEAAEYIRGRASSRGTSAADEAQKICEIGMNRDKASRKYQTKGTNGKPRKAKAVKAKAVKAKAKTKVATPKKRGRPAKAEAAAPKRRGRPPKVSGMVADAPRPRGRPRKIPEVVQESLNLDSIN